jgi:hypothetical protein
VFLALGGANFQVDGSFTMNSVHPFEVTGGSTFSAGGPTSITASSLFVDGTIEFGGSVSTSSSNPSFGSQSVVSPGASIGQMDVNVASGTGELLFQTGATYEWEVGAGGAADLISVTGDLRLENGWILKIVDLGAGLIDATNELTLFTYTGTLDALVSGDQLVGVTIDGSMLNPNWNISGAVVGFESIPGGSRIFISGIVNAPEPRGIVLWSLIGVVLIGLICRRRRAWRGAPSSMKGLLLSRD